MENKDFIEETCNYYNINNRGINMYGSCTYFFEDKKCAIGRLFDESKLDASMRANINRLAGVTEVKSSFFGIGLNMTDFFQEQYKTIPLDLLRNIQSLHDNGENWNENGLSESGLKYKNELIALWS